MKAARHAGFEKSFADKKISPSTRSGARQSRTPATRAVINLETLRNLANASSIGLGELLIYELPNKQAETSS